jgi:hypothetical protein
VPVALSTRIAPRLSASRISGSTGGTQRRPSGANASHGQMLALVECACPFAFRLLSSAVKQGPLPW